MSRRAEGNAERLLLDSRIQIFGLFDYCLLTLFWILLPERMKQLLFWLRSGRSQERLSWLLWKSQKCPFPGSRRKAAPTDVSM